jgi:sugar phosphate isomerase/epimerase
LKLSFSTNAFVRHALLEAVAAIAALGYDGVEILADAPHLFAPEVKEGELLKLKSVLETGKISVANINANTACGYYGRKFWEPLFEPSLANPDREARNWRIAYTRKCIDIAASLSCPAVSITSGRMIPGTEPERSLDILLGSLESVLSYAEQRNVRLGMEYEPGLLIESCDELLLFLERVGSLSLGANLDLGHSFVLGEDVEKVIRKLAGRIFHVHLEDIRGRKHYHLIPGTGELDFSAQLGALDRAGYSGFVTVELYTYPQMAEEAARRAISFLKDFSCWERKENRQCA